MAKEKNDGGVRFSIAPLTLEGLAASADCGVCGIDSPINSGGFVGARAARPQLFEVEIFGHDPDYRLQNLSWLLSLSKQKNKKKLFEIVFCISAMFFLRGREDDSTNRFLLEKTEFIADDFEKEKFLRYEYFSYNGLLDTFLLLFGGQK